MIAKQRRSVGLRILLEGEQVRRVVHQDQTLYAAMDAIAVLADAKDPAGFWEQLKTNEPQLLQHIERAEFPSAPGRPDVSEGLQLEGLLRLIESIPGKGAERLKGWIAQSASQHLREADNPELLALRARRLYEQRGYSRRWVDKRLRGVSARQELTGEWSKRGAADSEEYRALTNRLMQGSFGMDVEGYRRYKRLSGTNQHLRDHMSDLELALTSLAETAAVALHQARDSKGVEQLDRDVTDAGRIVARTREQIEQQSGRPVVRPDHHLMARPSRRRSGRIADLADKPADMHNQAPSHPVRTVA